MSWKRFDFHEDMRSIGEDEGKYPEDWHRGKRCHSEGTDNNQVERIFKRWRTWEERRYGIGGVGGVEGHRMAWGPRPVVGLIWDTCASSHISSPLHGRWWNVGFPRRPVPSVLAQVGAYWPVMSFLTMFHFSGCLGVIYTTSCHIESSVHVEPSYLFVISKLRYGTMESWKAVGKYGVRQPSRFWDATLINMKLWPNISQIHVRRTVIISKINTLSFIG